VLFDPSIDAVYTVETAVPIAGLSFAFDWENECYFMESGSPVTVYGEAAIKEFIQYIMRVVRGRYAIHPEDFGASPVSLVGTKLPRGAELSELERYIKETIAYCPGIQSVGNVTWDGEKVLCEMTLSDNTTTITEVVPSGP